VILSRDVLNIVPFTAESVAILTKRRPCEAKIPADRSVTPVTLIKKLISQYRTIFLYSKMRNRLQSEHSNVFIITR